MARTNRGTHFIEPKPHVPDPEATRLVVTVTFSSVAYVSFGTMATRLVWVKRRGTGTWDAVQVEITMIANIDRLKLAITARTGEAVGFVTETARRWEMTTTIPSTTRSHHHQLLYPQVSMHTPMLLIGFLSLIVWLRFHLSLSLSVLRRFSSATSGDDSHCRGSGIPAACAGRRRLPSTHHCCCYTQDSVRR